jgi:hypothetical protein
MDCAKTLLLPKSPRSCLNLGMVVHSLRLLGPCGHARRQLVSLTHDEQRQFECILAGNTNKRAAEEQSVRLRMLQTRAVLTIRLKVDSLAALPVNRGAVDVIRPR